MELTFANLVELQSSVVLSPRIPDQGIGAVGTYDDERVEPVSILEVNGCSVETLAFEEILGMIRSAELPIRLKFDSKEEEKKIEEPVVSKLSAWTSRMMGASMMMEKASPIGNPVSKEEQVPPSKYTIFLQSSTGAYVPANGITNAAILTVRKSVTEAIESDAALQWYKRNGDNVTLLEGATRATFLPTATEVGYSLQVVVNGEETVETTTIVAAATALFSAARRSRTPISGIHGRNTASGRTFRLEMVPGLSIYQVSQKTAEMLHDVPLTLVNVISDHGNAKNFTLEFSPKELPQDCMLAALCEDYRIALQAPNRLARESVMLAIGMANYSKDDLHEQSILFGAKSSTKEDTDETETTADDTDNDSDPPEFHGDDAIPDQVGEVHHQSSMLDSESSSSSSASVGSSTLSSQQPDDDAVLRELRAKLARKDKVISELQRQLTQSDKAVRDSSSRLKAAESECRVHRDKYNDVKKALDSRDKRIDRQNVEMDNIQAFHETTLEELHEKLAKLERSNRTLENEKDLLVAKVEARDSKLDRMKETEELLESMKAESSKNKDLHSTIQRLEQANAQLTHECESLKKANEKCGTTLESVQSKIPTLERQIDQERKQTSACQQELDKEQMTIQKLRAERNSYKQKSESLAKEMNRICRNGRSVREVEKILADDAARRDEVEVLRGQKRKLTQEMEQLRKAYDESLNIQRLAGLDHDAAKLLERNSELERLLSELTEYLNAKEMQLETMRQVNDALQKELRQLAAASMTSNDV